MIEYLILVTLWCNNSYIANKVDQCRQDVIKKCEYEAYGSSDPYKIEKCFKSIEIGNYLR